MKVSVDQDVCIGSGNCMAIAPDIFQVKDGVAHVRIGTVPEGLEGQAREAMDNCPVQAISEV